MRITGPLGSEQCRGNKRFPTTDSSCCLPFIHPDETEGDVGNYDLGQPRKSNEKGGGNSEKDKNVPG